MTPSFTVVTKRKRGSFGLDNPRNGRFAVVSADRRTVDGITFDSAKEMKRYQQLKLLECANKISCLERQPKFRIEVNGKLICTYTADFAYFDESGRSIIEDAKSTGTAKDAAYRLRKKLAEAVYNIKVTEVIL